MPVFRVLAWVGFSVCSLLALWGAIFWYQEHRADVFAREFSDNVFEEWSLDPAKFEGPVIFSGENISKIYKWRSVGLRPILQLEISPYWEWACLYRVDGERGFHELRCKEIE